MLNIKVEATLGDAVEEIAKEMIALAKKLDSGIESKISGGLMWATPDSTFSEVLDNWKTCRDVAKTNRNWRERCTT